MKRYLLTILLQCGMMAFTALVGIFYATELHYPTWYVAASVLVVWGLLAVASVKMARAKQ